MLVSDFEDFKGQLSLLQADRHAGSWRNGKSNLDKLKTCISNYLPSHWSVKKVEDYLLKVDAVVAAAWKVFAKVST